MGWNTPPSGPDRSRSVRDKKPVVDAPYQDLDNLKSRERKGRELLQQMYGAFEDILANPIAIAGEARS